MNTIAKRILGNAQKYPQRIAIVDQDGTRETTWTTLLEVAIKIACHARREGLSGIVPILQGRTMEYVASILGLNMAGIAVVNLTDTYPEERINYVCKDVGASMCVDGDFVDRALSFPIEPFEPCGDLSDIAMLLYTSGSTGAPKGVMFDNNCLLQSINRNIQEVKLDKNVVYSSAASFSFAMIQFELLSTLAAGATVHILTEDCRKNIVRMSEYFNNHQVTHAFIPYQIYKQMNTPLPFMKLVLLAGEKMSDMVPRTYKTMLCYAMSETTAFVTYFTLDMVYAIPPIGKPASDMSIYLLDANGHLCDEGEICIAGPLAMGYWNHPDLTEKTFLPNPFATGEHDKVLLHTGDIAKRLPDGNLLYLNRNDWMVKINGQRVEPGEIEAVMQQLPEINQAVVKSFVNEHGRTYLCGFYTVNRSISDEDIHANLAKKLPVYMQPRYLTRLDAFPVNVNGKLDRLALKAPKAAEYQAEYIAPETPEEELLCRAFETTLDVRSVGVLDNFFHMGGDSLSIIELMAATEALQLKTDAVFKGKTPRGIAALLKNENATQPDLYADCQEERTFYPLTASQRVVLRTYLLAPWSTSFNIAHVHTFPLDANAERIRDALLAVFAHYPILSMKIAEHNGIYGMVKRMDMKFDIPIIDIKEYELEKKKKEFVVPFKPEEDLLIRSIIFRTEQHIYLFFDVYHMIMDGSSRALFFKQFVRAYHGETLVPEQLTQFELSNHEQKYLKSELLQQAQEHFAQKLGGHIFPSEPAFDHPEYAGGVRKSLEGDLMLLDQELTDRIGVFLNTHDITVATFFMGALAYALKEMTKNEQVYFLSIESGRHDPRLQNTLGQLIQYMPITVSFSQEASDTERLRKIQTDFIETWSYDCYPFELLESRFGVSYSVVFNYIGDLQNGFHLLGQVIPMEFLMPQSVEYNLILCVMMSDNQYGFILRYNAQAYEKTTIDKLTEIYKQIIERFLN